MSYMFIVWRVDFDSMENREPIVKSFHGCALNREDADAAAKKASDSTEKYDGLMGGWGGERTTYPRFEVQEIAALGRHPRPRLADDAELRSEVLRAMRETFNSSHSEEKARAVLDAVDEHLAGHRRP